MKWKWYPNQLDRIEAMLTLLLNEMELLNMDIDQVLADVAELPSIDESLDAVFAQLQQLVAAAKTDPAKLQQLDDFVNTHKARVKASILANTPQAPTPPPPTS